MTFLAMNGAKNSCVCPQTEHMVVKNHSASSFVGGIGMEIGTAMSFIQPISCTPFPHSEHAIEAPSESKKAPISSPLIDCAAWKTVFFLPSVTFPSTS